MSYRTFAPGVYEGKAIYLPSLRQKKFREGLIGKRIGYDLRGSCLMAHARVTGVCGQELVLNNSDYVHRDRFTQLVILDEQGDPNDSEA